MLRSALALALCAALLCAAHGQVSTYTFEFAGGYPFCTSCSGPGQYACSGGGIGDWREEFKYTDRGLSSQKVAAVSVTLVGNYACDFEPPTMVEIDLNGFPVNAAQFDIQGTGCTCESCDGSWIFTAAFPKNVRLPKYNIGRENTVRLNVERSEVCLSSFSLAITYEQDTIPFSTDAVIVPAWSGSPSSGYKICSANPGEYTGSSSWTSSFKDIVPSGSKLVQVSVSVLGQYWCGSDEQTIKATLQGLSIGTVTKSNYLYPGGQCTPDGCDQTYFIPGNVTYQNGWPGYVPGADNTISITTSSTIYLNRVMVYLSYYP